jgi:YD repeat-containing protein
MVNGINGNLIVTTAASAQTDSIGASIVDGFSYNSQNTETGSLGPSWVLNGPTGVRLDAPNGSLRVWLHGRTGVVVPVDRPGSPGPTASPDSMRDEFAEPYWLDADLSSAAWGFELRDRRRPGWLRFSGTGALIAETLPEGERSYGYSAAGELSEIRLDDTEMYPVSYEHGRITSVGFEGAQDGRWEWAYDQNGRLTTFSDSMLGVSTYGYDEYGLLRSVTSQFGGLVVTYDQSHRVHSLAVTANGRTTTTTYAYSAGKLVATPSAGQPVVYYYDQNGKHYSLDATAPTLTAKPVVFGFVAGDAPWELDVRADDDRSGVSAVRVERQAGNETLATQAGPNCLSATTIQAWEPATQVASSCDRIFEARLRLDPAVLPEGHSVLNAVATDGGMHERTTPFDVLVDRTAPTISLAGSLYDLRTVPIRANETRSLSVTASDGVSNPSPAQQRAGIKYIGITLDGEPVAWDELQPGGTRTLTLTWQVVASSSVGDPDGDADPGIDDLEPATPVSPSPEPWEDPSDTTPEMTSYSPSIDDGAHSITVVTADILGHTNASSFAMGPAYTDDVE